MTELPQNHFDFRLPSLTTAEVMVLYVLQSKTVKQDDIKAIAQLCNLTKLQTNLALQLLQIKNLYPSEDMKQENPA